MKRLLNALLGMAGASAMWLLAIMVFAFMMGITFEVAATCFTSGRSVAHHALH